MISLQTLMANNLWTDGTNSGAAIFNNSEISLCLTKCALLHLPGMLLQSNDPCSILMLEITHLIPQKWRMKALFKTKSEHSYDFLKFICKPGCREYGSLVFEFALSWSGFGENYLI